MPRILLCSPTPITPQLGASKVYIEAAEAFRRLGWEVDLVGPSEVADGAPGDLASQPLRLRDYLRRRAEEYDVVEYEHYALPFPRSDFPVDVLMVARSVLLAHVQAEARIPPLPTLRGRAGRMLKWWSIRRKWARFVAQADRTLLGADLINLPNTVEKEVLVRHGHPSEKMLIQPFGLFPDRLNAFSPDPDHLPDPPVVAFVGTFDPRKGLCEFPEIVGTILQMHPTTRFRFIGTAGQVPTADRVLGFFPRSQRPLIEVIPKFDPSELPVLLRDCSVGVFPSRCEGFPFGVLEMLAAALPVVAYDAPGPPMMLPPEWLVPCGHGSLAGRCLAGLLTDPTGLRMSRHRARSRAADFRWEDIASQTAERYDFARSERRTDLEGVTR